MTSLINTPPNGTRVEQLDAQGRGILPMPAWQEWFMQVFRICFADQQSGSTASRPTTGLWVGRPYFDTDLDKPIWVDSTGAGWVDATGAPV